MSGIFLGPYLSNFSFFRKSLSSLHHICCRQLSSNNCNATQNIIFILSSLYHIFLWRYPRCNGYRRKKWTRRDVFKSWTWLIAFHIALIPLGKVWIQLFSLQLWVNSRTDWFFSLGEATSLGERKLWFETCYTPLKKWPYVISCPRGGFGK